MATAFWAMQLCRLKQIYVSQGCTASIYFTLNSEAIHCATMLVHFY